MAITSIDISCGIAGDLAEARVFARGVRQDLRCAARGAYRFSRGDRFRITSRLTVDGLLPTPREEPVADSVFERAQTNGWNDPLRCAEGREGTALRALGVSRVRLNPAKSFDLGYRPPPRCILPQETTSRFECFSTRQTR
jgi:hypothetical protein